VGSRVGLDTPVAEKEKSHYYHRWELNPGRPARTLVYILTELSRFLCIGVEIIIIIIIIIQKTLVII